MRSLENTAPSVLANKLLRTYFANLPKDSIVETARVNKVLYQTGILFPEVQKSSEWLEISKRRTAQKEELVKFNEVAEAVGLQYVVFKTFRFPDCVPDDVDILVLPSSKHLISQLVSKLIHGHGYFVRSKGTTEMTIRKVLDGTYVDFDIHADLGAGPYVYLDSRVVFKNSANINLGNTSIPVVNREFDLIICAAHALMKEFELTLADALTFIYSFSTIKSIKVLDTAKKVGLANAVYSFWRLSQLIVEDVLNENIIVLPYRIPIYFTLKAYTENMRYQMKFRGLKPVKNFLMFPHAKGVKKLFGLK